MKKRSERVTNDLDRVRPDTNRIRRTRWPFEPSQCQSLIGLIPVAADRSAGCSTGQRQVPFFRHCGLTESKYENQDKTRKKHGTEMLDGAFLNLRQRNSSHSVDAVDRTAEHLESHEFFYSSSNQVGDSTERRTACCPVGSASDELVSPNPFLAHPRDQDRRDANRTV